MWQKIEKESSTILNVALFRYITRFRTVLKKEKFWLKRCAGRQASRGQGMHEFDPDFDATRSHCILGLANGLVPVHCFALLQPSALQCTSVTQTPTLPAGWDLHHQPPTALHFHVLACSLTQCTSEKHRLPPSFIQNWVKKSFAAVGHWLTSLCNEK